MSSWCHTLLALAALAPGALLAGCAVAGYGSQPVPIDHNIVPYDQGFMTDPSPFNVPRGTGSGFDGLNTIGSSGNGLGAWP